MSAVVINLHEAAKRTRQGRDFYDVDWDDIGDELADSTKRAYRRHLAMGMPSTPAEMVDILKAQQDRGLALSTLKQCVAAHVWGLEYMDADPVASHRKVRAYLAGVSRNTPQQDDSKRPFTAEHVLSVLPFLKPRDQLLAALAFGIGLRRSEVVSIRLEDIDLNDDEQWEIYIPKAKQRSRTVVVPEALLDRMLLQISKAYNANSEFLFPGTGASGHIGDKVVCSVAKEIAERNGLEPDDYGGHSFRSGFVITASDLATPLYRLMRQTGHQSTAMVLKYTERATFDAPDVFNAEL